jgi:signal transduction histidine kinase
MATIPSVTEMHAHRAIPGQRAPEDVLSVAALVAAIPAAVVVEDAGRQVLLVNERFRNLFALPRSARKLAGTNGEALVHDMQQATADPELFARRIDEVIAAGELVPDEEVLFADGTIYDRDYVPLRGGRHVAGHLWMYWDVTERRQLEEQREHTLAAELTARKTAEAARRQMAEQNSVLRNLDQLRIEYMATLSHELRTPLTSIISFAGLLRECQPPLLPPDAAEFVDIIERNADRMLGLLADLLLLARLESGVLPLDLAPVPVTGLIKETVRARSAAADKRGVILRAEVTSQGPPLVADRQRLLQVLDNLVSNAIKFTDPGGHATVKATWDGVSWRIDVADSGIGVPREDHSRVFDRFFRAANARIAQVPGTGLGLSVVKAIVELHGGRIEVCSAPGGGTTFSLFFHVGKPANRGGAR